MLSVWKHSSLYNPLLLGEGKDFVHFAASCFSSAFFFFLQMCCLFGFAKALYPVSFHCAQSCLQLLAPEHDCSSPPSCSARRGWGCLVPHTQAPDALWTSSRWARGEAVSKKDPKCAYKQLVVASRQLRASPNLEAAAGMMTACKEPDKHSVECFMCASAYSCYQGDHVQVRGQI